jgi:prepilin-type N-terminal cleavage/methylation domain-containing protein
MKGRKQQSGFSAIEALAALAIVAIALAPLLSLQIQVSRDFMRQREGYVQATAQRNSLAILRDLNLMETPAGTRALGAGVTMHWTAQPISRSVRTTRRGAGDGDFDVILYSVRVTFTQTSGEVHEYSIEQVGWRRMTAPVTAP